MAEQRKLFRAFFFLLRKETGMFLELKEIIDKKTLDCFQTDHFLISFDGYGQITIHLELPNADFSIFSNEIDALINEFDSRFADLKIFREYIDFFLTNDFAN